MSASAIPISPPIAAVNISNPISGPISAQHVSSMRKRGSPLAETDPSTQGANPPSPPASPRPILKEPKHYEPKGSIPDTALAASVISAALGALAGACVYAVAGPVLDYVGAQHWAWVKPQLGVYFTAMALFHLLEYWTTAGWNPEKLSVDAFLLNNGHEYHIAHGFGLAEYFVSSYLWPSKFNGRMASPTALAIYTAGIVFGQTFRSLAMVHAARSFSHIVKTVKLADHTLVTTGVYRFVRHPSYVGFFYWAVATQLLLSNVLSTIGFVLVLGRFFYKRILNEERHLVRFFGDEYVQYRKRVGTGLPFV